MSNSILKMEQVHKSYKELAVPLHILKGVTLDVSEGVIWSIMGSSGAGKSTLLHVMGGLDRPTSGRVVFMGQDIYRLSSAMRSRLLAAEIGFVFQSYHLLPELTVLENVMLPAMGLRGAWRSQARNRARAMELLTRVGLEPRHDHRPTELSGGEQQRASLARSLMNGPSLLLADEPTGNLDSETGGTVLDYLFEMVREHGITMLMVTHDDHVARRADAIHHLRDGMLDCDLSSAAEGVT